MLLSEMIFGTAQHSLCNIFHYVLLLAFLSHLLLTRWLQPWVGFDISQPDIAKPCIQQVHTVFTIFAKNETKVSSIKGFFNGPVPHIRCKKRNGDTKMSYRKTEQYQCPLLCQQETIPGVIDTTEA